MLKNKLLVLAILFTVLFWGMDTASADTLTVDGRVVPDCQPAMINGSLMVPLVPFSQALGLQAQWNPELQNLSIKTDAVQIYMYVGVNNSFVNKVSTPVSVPPRIIDNQVYIPLAFVCTTFGFEANLDENTRTVSIISKPGAVNDQQDLQTEGNAEAQSQTSARQDIAAAGIDQGAVHTQGTINEPDGGYYSGEIQNGLPEGQGEYHYPGGDVYKGNFSRGMMNGYGILFFKNGNRYQGNWLDSHFDGYGEFTFANGTVYRGYFKAGLAEGTGIIVYPDKQVINGIWHQGRLISRR